MLKRLINTALLIGAMPGAAPAQFADEPADLAGTCKPQSGVAFSDSSFKLACTQVTVMVSEQGKVLLLFTDSKQHALGFQGAMDGGIRDLGADEKQRIILERLYMGGKQYHVASGTCVMKWSGRRKIGGKLTAAECDANAEAGTTKIKATAGL
jgi:hypothetical protein